LLSGCHAGVPALENARLYLERRATNSLEAINAVPANTTAVLDLGELFYSGWPVLLEWFRIDPRRGPDGGYAMACASAPTRPINAQCCHGSAAGSGRGWRARVASAKKGHGN